MNHSILYFFHNFANQSVFLDNVIIFFAAHFQYVVISLAVIFLLMHHEVMFSSKPIAEFKKKWKEIVIVFFSGIFAWILASIFKIFFHAMRPFEILGDVRPLFSPVDYAFPSGHATFFFALAFSLFFSHRITGILFLVFAIIISTARIVAGVHFPSDILGGLILGFVVSLIIHSIYKNEHN